MEQLASLGFRLFYFKTAGMSQKHIEDMVENTVVFLAKKSRSPRLRDWIWNLYQYEAKFDTSFTAFRQMDLLLKHGVWFQQNPTDCMTPAQVKKMAAGHVENGEAYFEPPYLYTELGSKVWRKWVAKKLLKGKDARKPEKLDVIVVVAKVASLEAKTRSLELTRWWFGLLADDLVRLELEGRKRELAKFKKLSATKAFLKFAREANAAQYMQKNKRKWPFSSLEFDSTDLESSDIMQWWFGEEEATPVRATKKIANPVRAFRSLDQGPKPTTRKARAERHQLGQQMVANALASKLPMKKWIDVWTDALLMLEWGPFGTLYGTRFLAESLDKHVKTMNTPFVIIGLLRALEHASNCRVMKCKRWPTDSLAFRPGKNRNWSDHRDEQGKSTVEYILLALERMPQRELQKVLNDTFIERMLPECDCHPYFELEAIRQLRASKTKQRLLNSVEARLKTLRRKWVDQTHLREVCS